MSLEVTLHTEDAIAAFDWLGLKLAVATARALNRTADSARVAMTRAISADIGLKIGVVREQIAIIRATDEELTVSLKASGKRIPLINFGASGPEPSRGKGKGVSYRIGNEGRKRLAHAFIATMPGSGHRGVFIRRSGVGRGPIVELKGPSLPHVFMKHVDVGKEKAAEVLNKNLAHEVKFILKEK